MGPLLITEGVTCVPKRKLAKTSVPFSWLSAIWNFLSPTEVGRPPAIRGLEKDFGDGIKAAL